VDRPAWPRLSELRAARALRAAHIEDHGPQDRPVEPSRSPPPSSASTVTAAPTSRNEKPATTRGSTRIFGMESRRVPRLNPEAHNTVKDALTRKARGPVVLRNLPPPVPPGREIQRWGDVTSPGAVSSVALWSRSLTRGRFPASGLAGVGEWTAICPTRKAGGPRSCHTASRLPLVPEGFWRIPQGVC
jgi:hypothetical protein